MIKAIVVAASFHQYATYMRNRNLRRDEYGYYRGGHPSDCYGLSTDTPVLWLEGWSNSKSLKGSDIDFLKHRFTNHKQVGETFIYGQGFEF
jgi:hypothetical protein